MLKTVKQVVTIAGVDSGGGAGIQADLKTFQARNVYGMNIVVALTAQNTLGVQEAMPVPTAFIDAQFQSLAEDFTIDACKTGMLFDKEHVQCVVDNLKTHDFGLLVVDPVMVAKGGHVLLQQDAIDTIKTQLLPLATIVTPNLPETSVLVGYTVQTLDDMIKAAKDLQQLGVKNVIIKGGHLTVTQPFQKEFLNDECFKQTTLMPHDNKENTTVQETFVYDCVLLEDDTLFFMRAPRIHTKNTHGTGDTFSACLVSELAKGHPMKNAIYNAREYVQATITQGIAVGHGHGPLNHWATPQHVVECIAYENTTKI